MVFIKLRSSPPPGGNLVRRGFEPCWSLWGLKKTISASPWCSPVTCKPFLLDYFGETVWGFPSINLDMATSRTSFASKISSLHDVSVAYNSNRLSSSLSSSFVLVSLRYPSLRPVHVKLVTCSRLSRCLTTATRRWARWSYRYALPSVF